MRSLEMSTAIRLRSSFCSFELCVQLVQNLHLLHGGNGRVLKEVAQLRAAVPGGQKVAQLRVDGGRVQLGGGDHIGKGAGRSGKQRRPSSSALPCRQPLAATWPMNSAIRAWSVSGVRTSCLAACSMARSAAKWRKPRRAWAAATLISCSAACDDAGAFFCERGLDARLVLQAFLLHLGAKLLDLVVEPGQLGFDRAQAGIGVRGGLARRLAGCAPRVCERLRKTLGRMRAMGMPTSSTMMAKLKNSKMRGRGLEPGG